MSWNAPKPILTPCIGVCVLDAGGFCQGCRRSIDEIARWGAMGAQARRHLMEEVLPRRGEEKAAT